MVRLNVKQRLLGAAAGVMFLGLSAQAAHALTINEILLGGADTTPILSDNSAEFLINGPNDTSPTTVDEGDRLRGILQIGTIENPGTTTLSSGGNPELSAFFDVTVTSKTCTVAGCTYTFGATDTFAAEVGLLGFEAADGAAIAFFEDTSPDFTRVDGTVAGETSAIDGDAFWLFGFDSGEDFWVATTFTDDLTVVAGLPPLTDFGDFAAGLSLLDNPTGIDLGFVSCFNPTTLSVATVQACGIGNVLNPDEQNEGYDVWDDVNFTINTVAEVPEPATLSLFGLGLLGFGYASFRRKRRQKSN
jgi:hypothetical protein